LVLDEILLFIDRYRLFSLGLSIVDVEILAGAALADSDIMTADKRLQRARDYLRRRGPKVR